MKIITNNHARDVVEGYELTEKERKEFDYINWGAVEKGEESPTFVRYKRELYDLNEFMTTHRMIGHEFAKWDGYRNDTFFSGMLVKYLLNGEAVVCGRYYG